MTATLPAALLTRAAGLAAILPHAPVVLHARPGRLCLIAASFTSSLGVAVPAQCASTPWSRTVSPLNLAATVQNLLARTPFAAHATLAPGQHSLSITTAPGHTLHLQEPAARPGSRPPAENTELPDPPVNVLRLPAAALAEALLHIRIPAVPRSAPPQVKFTCPDSATLRLQAASLDHLCRVDLRAAGPTTELPACGPRSLAMLAALAAVTAPQDDILLAPGPGRICAWLPQPPGVTPAPLVHAILHGHAGAPPQPPLPGKLPLSLRIPLLPLLHALRSVSDPRRQHLAANAPQPVVDLSIDHGHCIISVPTGPSAHALSAPFSAPGCPPATLRLPLRPLHSILSSMSAREFILQTNPRAPHRALLLMRTPAANIIHLLLLPPQPGPVAA